MRPDRYRKAMVSALVTGFGPFPRVPRNPSQLLVERLEASVAGTTVQRRILPTEYHAAGPLIQSLLDDLRPDICLCIGVGHAGDPLRLETTARNFGTVDAPDHSGSTFSGPIAADGPETYTATLPLDSILAALPVVLSNDAGGYVCNYIFFTARHHIARARLPTACGFLHIPELDPARDENVQFDAWLNAVRTILTIAAAAVVEPAARWVDV
jgi:pyroglutamyl-peptidase